MYVLNYDGVRVECSHPGEDYMVERELGLPEGIMTSLLFVEPKWWWSKKKKAEFEHTRSIIESARARTGFMSDCICTDCLQLQTLDLDRDERKCITCSSSNVKTQNELVGHRCPKCNKGKIVEIDTGIIT